MNQTFKIIFMGTPDFSVPCLKALHQHQHDVALVVTQPDRPKGRGRKLLPPPVKTAALEMGYTVIQPESVKTEAFAEQIRSLCPDFFVVAAFGHILPANVLAIPKHCPINIHASLLPKYRGSAPIQQAIINGEKETGVTTMLMDTGMDTGDMLLSEKTDILPDDTAATLHDRLAVIGAGILIKTLEGFANHAISPVPQEHERATYAPMLKKSDGHLDWTRPAEMLECLIRGMTPWPGAFTFHGDKRLKIFKASVVSTDTTEKPGTVIRGFADELRIAAGKDALCIQEIQGASGKRLAIRDFLRGYDIPLGTVLT